MLYWRQPYLWFQMRINMVFVAVIFLTPNTPSSSAISLLNPKFGNPEIKGLARNPKMIASWQHTLKEKNWDPTSPEGSWFLFNANDSYQKKKNKRKNCKRCSKNIPMPKEGPPGPSGPRGPQGPQGESGGTLSLGEIEDYIKTYVTDLLIQNKTISADFLKTKRRRSSFKENVPVVFTGQLPYKEKIPSQETSVIKGFTVTFGPGQFKRGVIVRAGKFTITREGVYQVSGTIPIQESKKKLNDSSSPTGDKTISVYVCVDNCLKDRRLKWTSSFSVRTSAVFNGHVRLKRGQSLMVLVSNPTSVDVEVLPGSTFSAALLGT